MLYTTPQLYAALPKARRGNLFLLLNLLLAECKAGNECLKSQEWIAQKCGFSVPTVRRCERVLAGLGLIESDHHRRGNSRALRLCTDRLASLLGYSTRSAGSSSGRESAITSRGTVENRMKGARAHSQTPRERPDFEPRRDARQLELGAWTGKPSLLGGAFDRFSKSCKLWERSIEPAWQLVRGIAQRDGEARAAAWLGFMAWHNPRKFQGDRLGAVSMGALKKKAGRELPRQQGRGPTRIADSLARLFPGLPEGPRLRST